MLIFALISSRYIARSRFSFSNEMESDRWRIGHRRSPRLWMHNFVYCYNVIELRWSWFDAGRIFSDIFMRETSLWYLYLPVTQLIHRPDRDKLWQFFISNLFLLEFHLTTLKAFWGKVFADRHHIQFRYFRTKYLARKCQADLVSLGIYLNFFGAVKRRLGLWNISTVWSSNGSLDWNDLEVHSAARDITTPPDGVFPS